MNNILQLRPPKRNFAVSVRNEFRQSAEGAQYDAVEDATFPTKKAADNWCAALNSHVGFARYQVVEKSR